jgi:ribose transport system ATP-binding protein
LLFYSTDYAELIGCCDKVLIFYDGAIVREFEGDAMNERNLVGASLNLGAGPAEGALPAAAVPAEPAP